MFFLFNKPWHTHAGARPSILRQCAHLAEVHHHVPADVEGVHRGHRWEEFPHATLHRVFALQGIVARRHQSRLGVFVTAKEVFRNDRHRRVKRALDIVDALGIAGEDRLKTMGCRKTRSIASELIDNPRPVQAEMPEDERGMIRCHDLPPWSREPRELLRSDVLEHTLGIAQAEIE